MLELAGPLAIVALVLAAGGVFKLRDPGPTRDMFATLTGRLHPSLAVLAVFSAALEVSLGVITFLVGGRIWAAITASAFLVFTILAWRLVRVANAPCGCFGRYSGRTTRVHVAVNGCLVALATVAGAFDAPGFVAARSDLPLGGVPFVAFALLGAWFAVAAMTALPEALLAARRGARPPEVRSFEITGAR